MKAIILAAGRGKRMKSLTDDRPKCLVEVKGKSLLQWQLSAIKEAGIDEIAIVTGYNREMLQTYGLKEFHNPKWMDTQMVTSLMCASEWLEKDTCVVSYSDILYDSKAVTSLIQSRSDLCITYDPNWIKLWEQRFEDPLSDAETFRVDKDGYLLEIGGKPQLAKEIQGQYMGLLKFNVSGWEKFKCQYNAMDLRRRSNIHMTDMLQNLVAKRLTPIKAVPYESYWMEYDLPTDVELHG